MRAKFVNEKFRETSDPIHDLGIGIEELVKKFEKDFVEKVLVPWSEDENIFKYFPDRRLIQIDCWPISNIGFKGVLKALKKLVDNKYKDSLIITHIPTPEEIDDEEDPFINIEIR